MRARSRALALAAATAVLAGSLGLAAPSALALNSVGAIINPATGSNQSTLDMVTDGGCTGGTNYLVRVFGNGFPATGYNVVGNTPLSVAGRTAAGGYRVPITQTMQTFADEQSPVAVLSGEYRFQFVCRAALNSTVLDDFNAFIAFSSPTAFATPDTADRKAATATSLAATPTGAVTQGDSITLTATLADAANVLGGGSYQFSANGSPLGAPVDAVDGVASTVVDTAALAGSQTFQATFAPSRVNTYRTSSATTTTTVNAPQRVTTTSLAVTPVNPTTADVVELVATVTAAGSAPAAGTVVFSNDGVELSRVDTTNGSATLRRTFALGNYSFTAAFVENAAFGGSSSAAAARTMSSPPPPIGATAFQDITTTVAAGALTITVTDTTVVLPSPVLNTAGSLLQTTGEINPVTITDTRAGNPGWNASGQVSDFAEVDNSRFINGSNLGWSPVVFDASSAQIIVAGASVAPDDGVAVGAAASSPVVGLKAARVLATAAAGRGNGTAIVGAGLALNVPTSTTAGTYTARLTFTAI